MNHKHYGIWTVFEKKKEQDMPAKSLASCGVDEADQDLAELNKSHTLFFFSYKFLNKGDMKKYK